MKNGTSEQWKELGTLCKSLHDGLIHAETLSGAVMPKKDYRLLKHAVENLSEFKSHAEDIMFRQKGNTATDDDLQVFYGQRK